MKWFVYVIWARDEDGDEVRYYGHTHDMKDREKKHKDSLSAWICAGRPDKLGRHACRSVFVLDMENWSMDVLHELECDEDEASRIEGNYIRYNNCVNRCVAGRTYTQWRQDNRETILQKKRQRYHNNKTGNAEKRHQYYEKNADRIKEKNDQKVGCLVCFAVVRRGDFSTHLKTQKHKNAMTASTSSS